MRLDWTNHVDSIALVVFLLGFAAWTFLAWWIGYGFGYSNGKQSGWQACRRFEEEQAREGGRRW